MIKVLVNGHLGRMGQATVSAIDADPDLILAGKTGHGDNLTDAVKQHDIDVVVDFTNAESVFTNCQTLLGIGVHPVIGTSGLVLQQVQELQKVAAKTKLGGIIAPNFSIGAVLMMQYAKQAAKYFPYAEIIEFHHNKKQDAPSGTAIKTAELIAENRTEIGTVPTAVEPVTGSRGANYQGVPIHAVRVSGMVASQEVLFGGTSETFKIRHDTIDRQAFMPGVCLACKKVVGLNELVYGLEHVL